MTERAESNTAPSGAKKWIILTILILAFGIFFIFVFTKSGNRIPKIIGEGDRAPEFALPLLGGKQVSLSALRGKVVMVHFWATWCPPCVEEMPTIDHLYRMMKGRDFEIIAVSVDRDGVSSVAPFIRRNRIEVPVALDIDNAVTSMYGTFKFPETYIVDKKGIVRFKVIGGRDWNDTAAIATLTALTEER